jgi:hypothetical protein
MLSSRNSRPARSARLVAVVLSGIPFARITGPATGGRAGSPCREAGVLTWSR